MPLGLPAVPLELKSISSFLQRADEVKATEPIVAYWCTYYAVQTGIGVKVKDPEARAFLGMLLEKLEGMKNDMSANEAVQDIIEHEIQSAAYLETFALKVFNLADNIDRSGKATRATAKQFLAASHFLEVLNVFDKAVREDSYEDKIKYAKWKAADIAKAFREGRQPTPGPAGGLEQEAEDALAASTLTAPPDSLPGVPSSTPGSSRPSIVDDTDTWSTPATPRVPHVDDFQSVSPPPPPLNSYESEPGWRPIIENEQLQPAQARAPVGRSDSTAAIVDGDTSATDLPHASSNAQALGISSEDGLTQAPPTAPGSDSAGQVEHVSTHDSIASQIPPSSTPSIAPTVGGTPNQPTFSLPPGFVPTSTPIPGTVNLPAAVVPPPPILHVQQPLVALTAPLVVAEAIKPSPKLPPPELTPKLIAAIQRHCKFAISALDYEDPETARMQLRSALDMLGG